MVKMDYTRQVRSFSNNELLPREKILVNGPNCLDDLELIAGIIGHGTRKYPLARLSSNILKYLVTCNFNPDIQSLKEVPGLGLAKSCLLISAYELFKRRIIPQKHTISSPKAVPSLVNHLLEKNQETFIVISLNGAMNVIAIRVVALGTLNSCPVHPRDVYSDVLKDKAYGIIVVHNHPSGSLKPSQQDVQVTKRLVKAAEILGIAFIDHIIVSDSTYSSFRELQLLPESI
jgi:DNA repair protein RadC